MKLALASERPPKVEAVRGALARLAALDPGRWQHAELLARATDSGVAATPLHDEELRRGARQRAEALAAALGAAGTPADLYLGLEGGVHVEEPAAGSRRCAWLRSWCYAWDGRRGSFGCGPSIALPESIAGPVCAGEDLSRVLDRVAGGRDLRSRDGTWGFVTRGTLTRALAFETAVLAALAPFYNAPVFETRDGERAPGTL